MVHHAHLVCFGIAYPYGDIVMCWHFELCARPQETFTRGHAIVCSNPSGSENREGSDSARPYVGSLSPAQFGLRFSRNEARPSLKSGVQRIRAFSRMARSRSWSRLAAAAEVSRCLARV